MENMTLFGLEPEPQTKKICIRSIRAIFSNEVIRENAPFWVKSTCTNAENVFELFRDLAQEAKENFVALHLNAKNRIICFDRVSIGSLSASIVHPREVYKAALLSSAAAVLFIHNHPSGDTTPSREDIEITNRLKEAGELLGIRVLDHLIIGETGYYSFADNSIL